MIKGVGELISTQNEQTCITHLPRSHESFGPAAAPAPSRPLSMNMFIHLCLTTFQRMIQWSQILEQREENPCAG
ncbi:mCG147595 [Mus musculus]|nr:mCG147595 [Mus musculus]